MVQSSEVTHLLLVVRSSPRDLERLFRLELDDADVKLLVVQDESHVLLRIVSILREIADALVKRPLDDGFGAKMVGVHRSESQTQRIVLEVVSDSLRHLVE